MSVARDTPPDRAVSQRTAPGAAPGAPVLLRCDGAAAGFGDRVVIRAIDLEVRAGETVAILGRSGCGKTTLLHLLAGLLAPADGTVDLSPAALMPQRDGLMPWASARDNAALPLRVAGRSRRDAHAGADAQLRELGLGDALGRRVADLSGGMRQRVALARTLLTGRPLLLLDEPLASVDALTRAELHTLLLGHLARDGHGAVLVTHDLDEAALLADRVLVLGPQATAGAGAGAMDPVMPSMRDGEPSGSTERGPATLRPGPVLTGAPGMRLEQRGGDPLRAAILAELAG